MRLLCSALPSSFNISVKRARDCFRARSGHAVDHLVPESPRSVRSLFSISAESMPFSSVVVTRVPALPSPSPSGNTFGRDTNPASLANDGDTSVR